MLQVCVTFNNLYQHYNEHVFELEGHNVASRPDALERMREWTYSGDGRIPLGVFYEEQAPAFEDGFAGHSPASANRQAAIATILQRRV